MAPRTFTRAQRTPIVQGMLAFVLILVILQLWLLTATMNAYLGGDDSESCGPRRWQASSASRCVRASCGYLQRLDRPS